MAFLSFVTLDIIPWVDGMITGRNPVSLKQNLRAQSQGFNDPLAENDIIRLPRLFRFLQRPLAQLISVLRARKSKEAYASIGGGSFLRKITDEQADALKSELEAKKVSANVYVAMHYCHPYTEEAAHQASFESIEPLLEEYRPPGIISLKFNTLSLGNVAPKIEDIRVQSLKKGQITMDIDFRWGDDPNIILVVEALVANIPIQVKDLQVFTVVRVIFQLCNEIHCISTIVVALLSEPKPRIDYTSLVKAFKYDAANIKPNGGQTSLIASTSNQQPLTSAGTIPFLQAATALPPPGTYLSRYDQTYQGVETITMLPNQASSYVSNVNSPIPQVSMQSVTTESFGLPNGGVPP
ncbi:synaptotagmin-5 [Tanacetum coccineum]